MGFRVLLPLGSTVPADSIRTVLSGSEQQDFDRKSRHGRWKPERVGKVTGNQQASSTSERRNWTFAKLLDWHLVRGTRPSSTPERHGKQWSSKEFGDCLSVNERTVRNWRKGRNTPDDLRSIESYLFGEKSEYDPWRIELRTAHQASLSEEARHNIGRSEQQADQIAALPYVSLGALFKGRKESLNKLRTSLTRHIADRAAVSVSALCGFGGVGKTRAAVEYAWVHRNDYQTIVFVTGDSPETLHENFAALSAPTILRLREYTSPTTAVRKRAVQSWLNARSGWLLIVDGIDTGPLFSTAEQLFRHLRGGHVLLTGRLSNYPADVDAIEILELSATDATEFLLERTKRYRLHSDHDYEAARNIADEDLGCLPLALEQAGAYIGVHRITAGRS